MLSLVVGHGKEGLDWQFKLDSVPEETPIIFRIKTVKNKDGEEITSLTFKASQNPLHDTERIEIELENINPMFRAIFSTNGSVDPESIWHSNRRIFAIDENTKIDIENVTGYGWKVEIESSDLYKVNKTADNLGLRPLTKRALNAMYKQYVKNWQNYYISQGGYYPNTVKDGYFTDEDWKEIESISQESIVRNRVY